MNLKTELTQFMQWYKNNVPIGTNKSSPEIVDDYLKRFHVPDDAAHKLAEDLFQMEQELDISMRDRFHNIK